MSTPGNDDRATNQQDADDKTEPSLQDAHNPETEEDTSSGGPAD